MTIRALALVAGIPLIAWTQGDADKMISLNPLFIETKTDALSDNGSVTICDIDLSAAIDNIGSNPCDLVIDKTVFCTTDTVVPSNIALHINNDGIIDTGNYKLRILGNIKAPVKQIFNHTFTGMIQIDRNSVDYVNPVWFGAICDNTPRSENATAIKKTIDSLPDGGTIVIPCGCLCRESDQEECLSFFKPDLSIIDCNMMVPPCPPGAKKGGNAFMIQCDGKSCSGSGFDSHWIDDTERHDFKVDDANLKTFSHNFLRSIWPEAIFPSAVFVRKPTKFNGKDYKIYEAFPDNKPESVYIFTEIASCRVFESEPTLAAVASCPLENLSSKPGDFTVQLQGKVSDSISAKNSITSNVGAKLTVTSNFKVNLPLGPEASGGTSAEINSSLSATTEDTITTTKEVNATAGLKVTLQPSEKVIAELCTTLNKCRVRVYYKSNINGSVAYLSINGNKPIYNIPSIKDILGFNKQPIEVVTGYTEYEYGINAGCKIVLRDPVTKAIKQTLPNSATMKTLGTKKVPGKK